MSLPLVHEREAVVLAQAETFLSSAATSLALFVALVALTCGLARCGPAIVDFFLARCRLPRNRRYQTRFLLSVIILGIGLASAATAAGLDFTALVGVGTLVVLALTFALQVAVEPATAGFWLQTGTLVEPGKLLGLEGELLEVLSLDALHTVVRVLGPVPTASSGVSGEPPAVLLVVGGVRYQERVRHIPNTILLRSIVDEYRRSSPAPVRSVYAPVATTLAPHPPPSSTMRHRPPPQSRSEVERLAVEIAGHMVV